jgi:hypothetical protein
MSNILNYTLENWQKQIARMGSQLQIPDLKLIQMDLQLILNNQLYLFSLTLIFLFFFFFLLLAYIICTKGFHCDTSSHAYNIPQSNYPVLPSLFCEFLDLMHMHAYTNIHRHTHTHTHTQSPIANY